MHDWFFLLPFNNLFPHSNIYCFLYPEPSYSKWIPYDSGPTQIQLYSRNIQWLFPYISQTSYIMSYWGIQLLPPILYYNYASSSSLCFQFSFKHVISFLYKILYLNAMGKEHKVFCQIWKRKKKDDDGGEGWGQWKNWDTNDYSLIINFTKTLRETKELDELIQLIKWHHRDMK